MRGEHVLQGEVVAVTRGSSPHARGAQYFSLAKDGRNGIIPACAGSTDEKQMAQAWKKDHPRMRGEHIAIGNELFSVKGSSPHARGARPSGHPLGFESGIIPACAGSTSRFRARACWPRDHPRMRGEHMTVQMPFSLRVGSSPHARGAR